MVQSHIAIDQSLHGYDEGHRLLVSSFELPIDIEQQVLIMSDMSGPSMVKGFESYYTAYPIPQINLYALAKTWYAPEQERPGCVWTHTLFISFKDLAKLKSLHLLRDLFQRPSKNKTNWTFYSTQLGLNNPLLKAVTPSIFDDQYEHSATETLFYHLYQFPDNPILIPAEGSEQYEESLFCIWQSQWPRLRRNFSFCTGAIRNRSFKSHPLDLQVIPSILSSEINQNVKTAVFIKDIPPSDEDFNEFHLLYKKYLCRNREKFLEFLWLLGPDTHGDRHDFLPLLRLFSKIDEVKNGKITVNDLIDVLAELFPSPNDAKHLKEILFSPFEGKPEKFGLFSNEANLLKELISTHNYYIFDLKVLNISERAAKLFISDRIQALEIIESLANKSLTPIGFSFFEGISSKVTSKDLISFLNTNPALVNICLRNKPSIAFTPSLWTLEPDRQKELFKFIISHLDLVDEELRQVAIAMLDAASDTLSDEMNKTINSDLTSVILNWYNQHSNSILGKGWQKVLSEKPKSVFDWYKANFKVSKHKVTELIITLINPHEPEIIEAGADIWLEFALNAKSKSVNDNLTCVLTFLLAFGFHNAGINSPKLVAEAFEHVHEAARINSLKSKYWALLDKQAPSLSWWSDWDKCQRLRNSLLQYFIDYEWPRELFLQSVQNSDIFIDTLKQAKSNSAHKKYLKSISSQVKNNKLKATPSQKQILQHFRL